MLYEKDIDYLSFRKRNAIIKSFIISSLLNFYLDDSNGVQNKFKSIKD